MNGLAVPLEQRMTALHKANEIRSFRAQKKKEVKRGDAPADFFLARFNDPRLRSMKLREALIVMPGMGAIKTDRIMARAGISPSRTLGGMSDAQRQRLYDTLVRYYPAHARRLGLG